MNQQLQKYQWILILVVAMIGGGLCMDIGHEWGDDFAMYLHQAQCWIDGGMATLFSTNKLCMDGSDGLVGPYLYPQGYPLFLSFFMRLFGLFGVKGLSLIYCLKWANYSVFLIVLVAYLRWLNGVFEGHWGKIFLGFVLLAWHPKIWEAADRLTSDLWFAGLVILFFQTLGTPFKGWISKSLTLSLMVFVATATRSNGVFLIGAWFVWEWLEYRKTGKVDNRVVSLMMGTVAGLFALYADAGNGSNHWQLLKAIDAKTILHNFGVYLEMAGSYPYWHFATLLKLSVHPLLWLAVLVFWILVFVGFRTLGPSKWAMGVFVLLNFGLYIVWPSVQGMRFLFPLLPFLIVFFVAGLGASWTSVGLPWLNRQTWIPAVFRNTKFVVRLAAAVVLLQGIMTSVFYRILDTNQAFSKEMRGVYDFVDNQVEIDNRISFHKPRLMRYVTGVETYKVATDYGKETVGIDEPVSGGIDQDQAIKKLQANQIDYWVLSREQLGRIEKPSLPIAFENKEFVVYKVSENKGSLSDSLKVD